MSYIPLGICLITLLNSIYRHDFPSSLVFLFGCGIYALHELKVRKDQKELEAQVSKALENIHESLAKKWELFDHNFIEINKKLTEHDNIITKGAIGLMSGLKKVTK